jgi:hypothetical protein
VLKTVLQLDLSFSPGHTAVQARTIVRHAKARIDRANGTMDMQVSLTYERCASVIAEN